MSTISLSIKAVNIHVTNDKKLDLSLYKNENYKVYKVVLFLANKFFLQTGLDLINPENLFLSSLILKGETESEKNAILKPNVSYHTELMLPETIVNDFDPNNYKNHYSKLAAITIYSDATRTKSPLINMKIFIKL